MSYLKTPLSEHGTTLPIPALDFARGHHVPVSSIAQPFPVAAGAYQITATVGVLISQAWEADFGPGSAFIAAGVPAHLLLEEGDLSIMSAVDDEGHVFIVPLKAV